MRTSWKTRFTSLTRLASPAIAHGFDAAGLGFFGGELAFGGDGLADDAAHFFLYFGGALFDVRGAAGAEVHVEKAESASGGASLLLDFGRRTLLGFSITCGHATEIEEASGENGVLSLGGPHLEHELGGFQDG